MFGEGEAALVRYSNFANRRMIVTHYTSTHPATINLMMGLFRLSRDVNPLHFAFERGWQVAQGKEAFTAQDVSRLGAAAEFFAAIGLIYGTSKAFGAIRPVTGGARTYGVDPRMVEGDIAKGVLDASGYADNPTATVLSRMLKATPSNRVVFRGLGGSKYLEGEFQFVLKDGRVVFGSRGGARMPHPTLVGGATPRVSGAGIVKFQRGQIVSIDNASGHFKPGPESMAAIQEAFAAFPKGAFSQDFIGFSRVQVQ